MSFIKMVEKKITQLEKNMGWLCDCLTFKIMFVLNPGHSFEEIRKKKYIDSKRSNNKNNNFEEVNNANIEYYYALSDELYQNENDRKNTVDEKNKVLLTITSIMFAAIFALISSGNFSWIWFVPLIFLCISIYMTLIYFGVETFSIKSYNDLKVDSDKDDDFNIKFNIIKANNQCTSQNSKSNDFKVSIYRTSVRALLVAVVCSFVCLILSYPFNNQHPQPPKPPYDVLKIEIPSTLGLFLQEKSN